MSTHLDEFRRLTGRTRALREEFEDEWQAIQSKLQADVKANDDAAAAKTKAWWKATPKKTCPRCGGTGIKKNEKVVYGGVSGGCYQCVLKGVVPVSAKEGSLVARDAELDRLRANWKSYNEALKAMKALAATATGMQKVRAGYDVKSFERMLKSIEDSAKFLKTQKV
jgi:hypothetical protein